MIYTYKDLDGNDHELYENLRVEEVTDVVSGKVTGYRVRGPYVDYPISKETYEAIKKIGQ